MGSNCGCISTQKELEPDTNCYSPVSELQNPHQDGVHKTKIDEKQINVKNMDCKNEDEHKAIFDRMWAQTATSSEKGHGTVRTENEIELQDLVNYGHDDNNDHDDIYDSSSSSPFTISTDNDEHETDPIWITNSVQTQFEDEYDILNPMSIDHMHIIYAAQRKNDGYQCAVKIIEKGQINRKRSYINRKRMEEESKIMRKLNHPYIVKIYDVYESKEKLYIVMEKCYGGQLFDRIKTKRRYKEKDAKKIIKMICEAIWYMIEQYEVVYCDLNPESIWFMDHNEDSQIKLIEFVSSKIWPRLRTLHEITGTPYYTAPEIINGDYSHPVAMWSLGVITYVMMFGFPPFYVDPNKFTGSKETKEIYLLILKGFEPVVKKGYGAWFPRALIHNLSEVGSGMDFISNLLQNDVSKRLTVKEALQHPWLSGSYVNIDLIGLSMYQYAISNKFKYIVCSLYENKYKTMRANHFKQLQIFFNTFLDSDNNACDDNKKIDYQRFEKRMGGCTQLTLSKQEMKQMFNGMDVNQSGYIGFKEFLNVSIFDHLVSNDERLFKLFQYLDENKSGHLNIEDMKNKMIELNTKNLCNDLDLDSMFDDVELDDDGSITYGGILRALHPSFYDFHCCHQFNDPSFLLIHGYIKEICINSPIHSICNAIISFYGQDWKLILKTC